MDNSQNKYLVSFFFHPINCPVIADQDLPIIQIREFRDLAAKGGKFRKVGDGVLNVFDLNLSVFRGI